MKNLLLPLIALVLVFFTAQTSLVSYEKNKSDISAARNKFRQRLSVSTPNDSLYKKAGYCLYTSLKEKLIPSWYGTSWDFSGTSQIPGQGKIACGYFVSTTLRDAGFQLNRYKMAQLHSFEEVSKFSGTAFTTTTLDSLQHYLNKTGEGIYIVGLDNHVGYISFENGTAWFIHSNYLSPACVVKERMYFSMAMLSSTNYKLGAISTNKELVRKWVMGEKILM